MVRSYEPLEHDNKAFMEINSLYMRDLSLKFKLIEDLLFRIVYK